MFKDSPSQIFAKKNLTKTDFLFGRIFLFSFFPFSSFQEEHFCKQKKPDSLYFFTLLFLLNLLSLSCRIFMFTLLVVALLTDKKLVKKTCVLVFSFAQFSEKKDKNIVFFSKTSSSFFLLFLFSSRQEKTFLRTNTFKIRAISFWPL